MPFVGSWYDAVQSDDTSTGAFFPSTYLDSPIVDTRINFSMLALNLYSSGLPPPPESRFELKKELDALRSLDAARRRWSTDRGTLDEDLTYLRPEHYPDVFRSYSISYQQCQKQIEEAWDPAEAILRATHNGLENLIGGEEPFQLEKPVWGEYVILESRARFWDMVVANFEEVRSHSKSFFHSFSILSHGFYISTGMVYFQAIPFKSEIWALSYEQLLMIKDAMKMRANGYLAARWHHGKTNLPKKCGEVWEWQELCLQRYGNEGYEILKSVESLAKTYHGVVHNDPLLGYNDSYSKALSKVAKKEESILAKMSSPRPEVLLCDHFHTILSGIDNGAVITEVFGLQKFSGHPLIDPRRGGLSAAAEARTPDTTLPIDAFMNRSAWCSVFLDGYLRKHNRWPSLEFSPGCNSRLYDLYLQGRINISRQDYPLSDWDDVCWKKNFDFDYFENYLPLMDDKAISFKKAEFRASWDHKITPTSNRRLLLELLLREDFDTRSLIETVERGVVPADWFIVSVTPKEREFKLAARMFSMLVMEVRFFFAIHEANIADTILQYVPQLTMVDSKQEVHERFLRLTKPLDSASVVRLFLELDLSRWNLRWRKYVVNLVGQDLNDLFGMDNVFTFGHEFFEKSMIVVRSPSLEPEGMNDDPPPESDLLWYNHKGGFEGILQKLWSLCTVGMIETAIRNLRASYTLTIQGDNVTMVVTQARNHSITAIDQAVMLRDSVIKNAELRTSLVGQDLKGEECVESMVGITYSKLVYFHGVDYPTTVKATSRLWAQSAIDFPSLPSYLGSIFSGAVSAAEDAKAPLVCYAQAVYLSSLYLTRAKTYPGLFPSLRHTYKSLLSREGIEYLLLLPSELGGFPILLGYHFLYRGGSDYLSKSLSGLKLIENHSSTARRIIASLYNPDLYHVSPSFESLLQDPHGLPFKKSVSPADAASREVKEVLRAVTLNKQIKEVIDVKVDYYKEELLKTLSRMTPFNALIARDILDNTVVGDADTLSRMFLKTRTLQLFSRTAANKDLTIPILRAANESISYMFHRFTTLPLGELHINSIYMLANTLRGFWSPAGVDMSHMTSYVPLDFGVGIDGPSTRTEIRMTYSGNKGDSRYSRGPSRPNLGAPTMEKRGEHGYKLYGRTHVASATRKLNLIYAQSDRSTGTSSFFDSISMSRGGFRLSELHSLLTQVIGGHSSHRYQAQGDDKRASVLGASCFLTWCRHNSDNAGFLSGTLDDYRVFFQEFTCFLSAVGLHYYLKDPERQYFVVRLTIGDRILDKLDPCPPGFPSYLTPPIPPLTSCKLLYDPDVEVRQVTGPILRGSIQPVVSPLKRSSIRSAVQAILRRHLRSRHSIRGHLEHLENTVDIQIDIQELRALTVHGYLECCAIVLIDLSTGILRSKTRSALVKHNISPLITTLGSSLIRGISKYLMHPLLRKDKALQMALHGPQPSYMGDPLSYDALTVLLSGKVSEGLTDPRSRYHTDPVVVFPDDAPDELSRSIICLLRHRLSRAVAEGAVSPDDADFCVGSTIHRLHKMAPTTEFDTIAAIKAILHTYPDHRRGLVAVSHSAADICHAVADGRPGYRLHIVPESAREVVRRLRKVKTNDIESVYNIPLFSSLKHKLERPEFASLSYRVTSSVDNPRVFRLQQSYAQKAGHPFSLGSGAMRCWWRLRPYISNKGCLVVGSGLGAAAVSFIRAGASRVYGIDLKADLPLSEVELEDYVPPLVRLYQCGHLYTQSNISGNSSGDWFDPKVSREIICQANLLGQLVIDIPTLEGRSAQVIEPLIMNQVDCTVFIRVNGTHLELGNLMRWIHGQSGERHIFLTSEYSDRRELVIRLSPPFRSVPRDTAPMELISSIDLREDQVNEIKTVFHFLVRLLAPTGAPILDTMRETLSQVTDIVENVRGEFAARKGYSQWTRTLCSYAVAYWLLASIEKRREIYHDLLMGIPLRLVGSNGDTTIVFPSSDLDRAFSHIGFPLSESVDHPLW